jgi:ribosomal protein L11 methyltransferase
VQPPWEDAPAGPGEVRIVVDPGMAFGTGSHPTTALCLERLDELLASSPGADVLDVGTGSGVIAFAAVKLGAGRVCGTENDPVALQAARCGAQLNGIPAGRIQWAVAGPDEIAGEPYEIVVANILLNTLVDLAPQIARKVAPRGTVVLSGLLAAQADAAEAAYAGCGLTAGSRKEREGWVRIELTRS